MKKASDDDTSQRQRAENVTNFVMVSEKYF